MMKKKFSLLVLPLLFAACSSEKPGFMKVEKNHPKYASTRSFENSPAEVKAAAKLALQELIDRSEPATNAKISEDKNELSTDWVYAKSKDKYVEYNFNGAPKRKILNVRRKYTYSINPSLAGMSVEVSTEEEIETVDLKSGEPKGWKKKDPDLATYDELLAKLKLKIREN